MMHMSEERIWIKIHLKSSEEISVLQKDFEVEIFRQTLRRVDTSNLLVEGYISKRLYDSLKSKFSVQILGDVRKMVKEASTHVSKINRYKKF